MKLKCLIVDDEPLAHNIIVEYAKELPYIEIVEQAYLPMVALQVLKERTIDLIFLDIQMPKMNGLEMLQISDTKAEVIITSAYEEYALKSYDLNVCDYLLKPFRFDRFVQATEKALTNHKLKQSTIENHNKVLILKSGKRFVQVVIDDIQYLESYGNYVKVWTTDNFVLTPKTLISLEGLLPDNQFVKIHKSFIVNKDKIDFLEGNTIKLKNGMQLHVSKNYKQEFLEILKSN